MLSSWSTSDSFEVPGSTDVGIADIAADPAGNVYAVGSYFDATGVEHAVVREKPSGSETWQTIADNPGGRYTAVAANAAGDVYVVGGTGTSRNRPGIILERRAGQATFEVVDELSSVTYAKDTYSVVRYTELEIDASGNVYAVGNILKPANVPSQGRLRSFVRRQVAGEGAFTTADVDSTNLSYASGVATIASGPAAGVYVTVDFTGTTLDGTTVTRKSTDGGRTWTNASYYDFDPATSDGGSYATAMASDAAGNLFVAARGRKGTVVGTTKGHPVYAYTTYWHVRRSNDGGVTWSKDDQMVMGDGIDDPVDVGVDPTTGSVYVIGSVGVAGEGVHGIVRSNEGGTWSTVDDVFGDRGLCFAADATGNLYTGFWHYPGVWTVRSRPAAAPFSDAPVTADPLVLADGDDVSLAGEFFADDAALLSTATSAEQR
jgi:hypothetical protein